VAFWFLRCRGASESFRFDQDCLHSPCAHHQSQRGRARPAQPEMLDLATRFAAGQLWFERAAVGIKFHAENLALAQVMERGRTNGVSALGSHDDVPALKLAGTPQLTQLRCEEVSAAAVENFLLEPLPGPIHFGTCHEVRRLCFCWHSIRDERSGFASSGVAGRNQDARSFRRAASVSGL